VINKLLLQLASVDELRGTRKDKLSTTTRPSGVLKLTSLNCQQTGCSSVECSDWINSSFR
jgi:hypothetical protein